MMAVSIDGLSLSLLSRQRNLISMAISDAMRPRFASPTERRSEMS